MKIRYQADADLNQKIVAATIRLAPSIDFRTADAAGLAGIDDPGVLKIAARDGRLLVTHDKSTMPDHFAEFITTEQSSGVLIVPRGLKLAEVAEELVMIWEASEDSEWINPIVTLPAHHHDGKKQKLLVRQAAWYVKPLPTFSDALATVRQQLWREMGFHTSRSEADSVKVDRAFLERLTDALCYAA